MVANSFVLGSALALLATLAAGISPSEIRSRAVSDFWSIVRHPFHARQPVAFLRNLDYKLKLRVCNAYPSEVPFDVYLNQKKIEKDFVYTDCFQYTGDLRGGDRLNFKVQSLATGSFTIDALPRQDATLLLVIARHGQDSLAAKFFSHVYADLKEPQVAVLDTYQGPAEAKIQLQAKGSAISQGSAPKDLGARSVMAVDEGSYQVTLGQAGEKQQKYEFNAWGKEAYAVIRIGMKSYTGKSYPEELVVFPKDALSDGPVEPTKRAHKVTQGDDEESEKGAASAAALPSLLLLLGVAWVSY